MTPSDRISRAFFIAYGVGIVLCIVWPLALQFMLGHFIIRPPHSAGDFVQELGYTFTGLSALTALFVRLRWRKVRAGFAAAPGPDRPGIVMRETLLAAALFELSAAYGIVYFALGGPGADRYSRTFIALPTIMYLVFVPRLKAWHRACP